MGRRRTAGLPGYQAIGGALCLDLANTLDWRTSAQPVEILVDGRAATAWARLLRGPRAGRITDADLPRLKRLRDTIIALVTGDDDGGDALALLNAELALGPDRNRLAVDAGGYRWVGETPLDAAGRLALEAARSAADLLTDPDRLGRVRTCAASGCGWLFLDESRAGNRRWCSMTGCGNRAKAKAHYDRRTRGQSASEA